jgi:hypothetical protein
MPNSLKAHANRSGSHATDSTPQPGDFPLGSAESRAAARAKVQGEQRLTPYDRDCLLIQSMIPLTYAYAPNVGDIESTEVGKRGWELRTAVHPIVPLHEDPFHQQGQRFQHCHNAYLHFYFLHHQFPGPGDVLHQKDVEARWGVQVVAHEVAAFRAAWARRLSQLPCPVKFDQGRVWLRPADSKPREEIWEESYIPETAPEIWTLIEAEALGKEVSPTEERATISAFVFREDEAGNYYIEPQKASRPWKIPANSP